MTKIVKRKDGYWITELPMETPDCGPYERLEGHSADHCAKEALKGITKFFTVDYWEAMALASKKKVLVKRKLLTDRG